MQRLREERGEATVDLATVGTVVSKGGRAMLRRGFPDADETLIETLLPRFLDLYAQAIATHTRIYDGVEEVLATLEARRIHWGVVTNKPGRLARALVAALGLDTHSVALVSGDCLPQRKPDPAQLLHACALAGVAPESGIYVGDDARDIEAGHRAGMRTVAAAWGYLNGENPYEWGADFVFESPRDLLTLPGIARRS